MTLAPCTQPGCTGQIEDGYCNVCGMPADAGPVGAPESGPTGVPGATKHPTVSTKLSSSPIGSARAGLSRPRRTRLRRCWSGRLR